MGHYCIFNGSRFRAEIAPRIAQFVRTFDPRAELIPARASASRRQAPPSVGGYDPASVAFTFAPANDVGAEPISSRPLTGALRRETLATSIMINGVVCLHEQVGHDED